MDYLDWIDFYYLWFWGIADIHMHIQHVVQWLSKQSLKGWDLGFCLMLEVEMRSNIYNNYSSIMDQA